MNSLNTVNVNCDRTCDRSTFWERDVNYWFDKLNSCKEGLSQSNADDILNGPGSAVMERSGFLTDLKLFIAQFKSPLMLLLIGAVILSAFLGDHSDVFIILFIVLSTGLLSFFQERNAGRVVQKLQSMISPKSSVIRGGQQQEINSSQILVGDVLAFKAGDIIPADCLLIESNELHANESSLTGESYPVRKLVGVLDEPTLLSERTNCLWQGGSVVSGSAKALVIHTGKDTIFGSITKSASVAVETTFEKGIKDFGYFLLKITLALSMFILVVNLLNHKSVMESALFALALAVGMAPELLPAITTIAMSAGAKRMLAKKVIVKKLASIQNLGEVDLLCTDKTGTITEGVIEVAGLVNGLGQPDEWVKQLAFYNATFETGYANPMDEALRQLKITSEELVQCTGEVPYDFIRRRLSIAIRYKEQNLLVTKGAFSQILGICSKIKTGADQLEDIALHKELLEKQFGEFGRNGLRSIGICYKNIKPAAISKEDETQMIFAGFILLADPVKTGIQQTIDALSQLGVKLKIITGDNSSVARATALKIGIQDPVIMTGEQLSSTSPEALQQLVKKTHIFAQVEPQQKEMLILTLRKAFTVAYMGDGINDVSAINAADVGISVENAVDVAREAADFVLMEKDLSVLVDGIKEGRKTFSNTLKYIYISTGSTFGNMCSVAVASLILPFLPMLPKQILLTNFLTDFPYLAVASDNVDQEQLEKPGKWDIRLIRSYMVVFGIHSSLFDIITFLALLFVLKFKETQFQTGWFIESVLSELFILFIIRTHKSFYKSKPAQSLFILSFVGLVITLGVPYTPLAKEVGLLPLPFTHIAVMLVIVTFYIITADRLKVWFFKKYKRA